MKNHFKVSVLGASGRMGSQIIKRVNASSTMELHSVVEHKGHNWIGEDCGEKLLGGANNILVTDDLNLALESADVVIDFSTHAFTTELVEKCASKDKSIVSDVSHLLLDQARIVEGELPLDTKGFTDKLSSIITRSLTN